MMKYKGYLGEITYDDEAKIFHGEVIGLKDVITFQGRSINELKKAFHESINDYLEWCRERGEKPEKILPIWDLANYTLQKYYNKNLSQVNSIYKLSVAVMVLGFALIVSILVATVYFKIDMKLDSIGIIAGIITEFIGATFLFIYKSTIKQALQHSNSLEEIFSFQKQNIINVYTLSEIKT